MHTATVAPKIRVLWLTNMMPPYRMGLWEELGQLVFLRIVTVEGDDPRRVSMARGSEWLTRDGQSFTASDIRTYKYSHSGTDYHITPSIGRVIGYLRNTDILIAGAWESPVYWQFMLLARIMGVPTVLFHESTDLSARFSNGPIYKIKQAIFTFAASVVVPGRSSFRSVLGLGVSEDKIFEGFNSIDNNHFRPLESLGVNYSNHRCASGHKYIYIGQLIERKNVGLLLDEFARIRATGDRLSIVGKGPLRPDLERLCQRLGIEASVSFVGDVTYGELPSLLHGHQTLVLPSSVEVWGLVVNEALAAGLHAVVAARCGVAASVRSMRGVHIWDEKTTSLGEVMSKSASEWTAPIIPAEIMSKTHGAFALTIKKAIDAALT